MECSGCCMRIYESDIAQYRIDDEDDLYWMCDQCVSIYLVPELNAEYFCNRDVCAFYPQDRFFVGLNGVFFHYYRFSEMAAFLVKGNNYLWYFGRGSKIYMSHANPKQMLKDLKEFHNLSVKEQWVMISRKTSKESRFTSNAQWKQKRKREIEKQIEELELKKLKYII